MRLVLIVMGATLAGLIGLATWAALAAIGTDDLEPLEATVDAVAAESAAVTDRFLDVAEASAGLLARNLERSLEPSDELQAVMTDIAIEQDVIDGVYVGYPTGDFLFVTKGLVETEGGLRIKQIVDADLSTRRVTERQVDASMRAISTTELPNDTYDPRQRPWYEAAQVLGTGWTEPYIFSSSGQPGITYFQPVAAFPDVVVGVDMVLTDVTGFLAERQPGQNGIAAMVSSSGVAIQGSNPLSPELLAEVERVAAQDQSSDRVISLMGDQPDRQVTAITPIGIDDSWWLVVSAREADFASLFSEQADRARIVLPILGTLLALAVLAMTWVARSGVGRIGRSATLDAESRLATRAEAHDRLDAMAGDVDRLLVVALSVDDADALSSPSLGVANLARIARHLRDFAQDSGIAGRAGTREFLIARSIGFDVRPKALLQTLQRELTEIVAPEPGPKRDRNPVRIGWFVVDGPGRPGLSALIRNADLALHSAEAGVDPIVEFDDDLQLPAVADQRLRRELTDAVDAGDFLVWFQPEVDLASGQVVGAEAVLRRVDHHGGIEPAERFIADLERLSVLHELTDLILDEAAEFAGRWGQLDAFTMRVNFSAVELNDDRILERLRDLTRSTAAQWCLELDERSTDDLDFSTVRKLTDLVNDGLEVALDDFGTGFSSLSQLRQLPITTLKIDRSFVEPLARRADGVSLAAVIHDLADRLDLSIVAEGVESEQQRRSLLDLGCNRGQGWLFAPAMSANDFVTWAQRQSTSGSMHG